MITGLVLRYPETLRIVLVLPLVLLVTACGGADPDDGRLHVVAGAYPLAFAAERVGGSEVWVENLTPPGAEPHDIELGAADVRRVREADVVLYLGSSFQPALADAAEDGEGEAIDLLDGADDPHVWLDPIRYARLVRRLGRELNRPAGAGRLAADLRALDTEFRRGLADCRRRTFVTSHAAFGHLARRYRLEQIAITGLSPEAEPVPRTLGEVVEDVRETGATTVFVEPLVSRRLAATVAREADVETAVLDPLEGLSDEQLEAGEDYFSVMRTNLRSLRRALGCR